MAPGTIGRYTMKVIVVEYSAYRQFKVPADVFLLPAEDNDGAGNDDIGSWWVKYDTLHYVDKAGKWQELKGGEVCCDGKRPISLVVEEVDFKEDKKSDFNPDWTLTEIPQFMMDELISELK